MTYGQALDTAVGILRGNLPMFTDSFQSSTSVNQFYEPTDNVEWTTGFLTGEYWLAYEASGDAAFRDAALGQARSFLLRIERKIDVDHHDMGFLYTPSCVAAYKLTRDELAKRAALLAADQLMARFREQGQFFQAWGQLGAPENHRLIIDCLMNLPLLYWASEVTGNPKYREGALAHTKTSLAHLVRPDSSTYHTYFFDPDTGAPLRGVTHQGRRDGSAWARGQAWGVYGLALSYRDTGDPACVPLFERVAGYFLDHLPEDCVPYWDLSFTEADNEPRDSSAAAIAACGMLEMAKRLPAERAAYYGEWARRIADALVSGYAVTDPARAGGLLLHGVYAKATPENGVTDRGVDECNAWGDYFYLELLTRLTREWEAYW